MLLLGYGSRTGVRLDSLRTYTWGKVRWRALDEGKEAWHTCRKDLIRLREEVDEALCRDSLSQKTELIDGIVKESGEN